MELVSELGKRHELRFVADLGWPPARDELRDVSRDLGLAVEDRGRGEFAGLVAPQLVAALINGATFQIQMYAGDTQIVDVNDELGEYGVVTLYLTDEELAALEEALAVSGLMA
jgi:hypothetical protein